MRDVFIKLIKRYVDPNLIVTETIVTGDGGNKQVTITKTRASVSYRMKNDKGDYDDMAVIALHERILETTADLLFKLTQIALEQKGKDDEPTTNDMKDHAAKFAWSFNKLLDIEVIFLSDVIYQEETTDEEGSVIGFTRLKEETDTFDDDEGKIND